MKNKVIKNKEVKNTGKRGVLFSIITFLLLFSLFSFAGLWSLLMSEKQSRVSVSNTQMSYLEDDIVSNAHAQLLWINLTQMLRTTNFVELRFASAGQISKVRNHYSVMNNYAEFVSKNYSQSQSYSVNLKNFTPSFWISPYNSTFMINGSEIFIYTDNYNTITNFDIAVVVNESDSKYFKQSTPTADTTGANMEIIVTTADGVMEMEEEAMQDPAESNNPFKVEFKTSSSVEIMYGVYNGKAGTLRIYANNLELNVTRLFIKYQTAGSKVTIMAGSPPVFSNITITSPFNTTKESPIVFAQE